MSQGVSDTAPLTALLFPLTDSSVPLIIVT